MQVKAVIFDLDGTITRPYLDFNTMRKEMGLDADDGPVLEAMENMTPQRRRIAEEILHLHETQAVTGSQLNTGAKETLHSLREANISIGVLTRNRQINALTVAQMHGLQFDVVLGREDAPAKPDAAGVLKICQKFCVRPQETIVVGDYLFDLLCAKAANAIAVLLINHENSADFAEHADFTIEKLAQILQIIKDKNRL
jgi:HAD superfamily hydrolase (TIGR01549 family)